MGDVWITGSYPTEIYMNENPTPVSLVTRYTDGAVSESTTSPKFSWQGTAYTHPTYGTYIATPANTQMQILGATPGYFVRFANLTPAVRSNGRNVPLFDFHYTINYWRTGDYSTQRTHKECISYYPAWC